MTQAAHLRFQFRSLFFSSHHITYLTQRTSSNGLSILAGHSVRFVKSTSVAENDSTALRARLLIPRFFRQIYLPGLFYNGNPASSTSSFSAGAGAG